MSTQAEGGLAVSQVLSVGKELVKLSLSGDERDPLTNLRLQKLLYYAQAWSLVIRESELFSDELEAWRHGPVVATVYQKLPDRQRGDPMPADAFAHAPDLPGQEAEFVRSVWEAYNQYSALQLSRMTHQEMPWRKAWGDRPPDATGNAPISVIDLEDFFATQTMPAPLAAYGHVLRKREEEAERKLAELAPLDVGRLTAAAKSVTRSASLRLRGG
jgi:uncharacterized phage-associated protein